MQIINVYCSTVTISLCCETPILYMCYKSTKVVNISRRYDPKLLHLLGFFRLVFVHVQYCVSSCWYTWCVLQNRCCELSSYGWTEPSSYNMRFNLLLVYSTSHNNSLHIQATCSLPVCSLCTCHHIHTLRSKRETNKN